MNPRNLLRTVVFAFWRAVQVTVIVPAALVGVFVAIIILAGQQPVQSTLEGIYQYAEDNIKPARPGHVLVSTCKPQSAAEQTITPPVLCTSYQTAEVSFNSLASSTTRTLKLIYLMLVALSVFGLLLVMPDYRKLLGLPAPAANT